jgi:hypothetical protein
MKELGLQDLLRYVLSGGIGIASLLLMYPKAACFVDHMNDAREVEIVLGSALVVGSLIYSVHRPLVYPVFFRVIGLRTLPYTSRTWRLINFWRPSQAEIDVDRWRWALKEESRRRWDEWGAQSHFLYCAAWAILLALVCGKCVGGTPNCHARCIFWFLFFVILVAGMVHNFRLLYSIAAEMNRSWPENS